MTTATPTTNMHRRSRRATMAGAALLAAATLASACSSGERAESAASVPTTATVPAPTTTVPTALERQLAEMLETHHANHEFVGAVIALQEPDGTALTVTSGTKGLDATSGQVDPSVPWGIGSITKTFVAVVVLQLAQEGAIDLDAGIGPYFPELPALADITPRQLLQHTSGLNEYDGTEAVRQNPLREWAPMELVAVAEDAGRVDEPGIAFHYANTNYIVLGELISRVTSKPWFTEVRNRILEPLDMRDTDMIELGGAPGFVFAGGTFEPFADRSDPSLGGAAGAMESTASDLLVYVEALAGGKLLSERMQSEMEMFIPGSDLSEFGVVHEYGLGFERYTADHVSLLGHLGTGANAGAFIGMDPGTDNAVVVMMNSNFAGPQGVVALEAMAAANASS